MIDIEPVADKCRAFGWDTVEIDGNDMAEIVAALHGARTRDGRPKAIVLRTLPGRGVPTLERREKAHFVRVEPHEWDVVRAASWRRAMSERAPGRTLGMGEKERTGTRPAVDAPFGHALAALRASAPRSSA